MGMALPLRPGGSQPWMLTAHRPARPAPSPPILCTTQAPGFPRKAMGSLGSEGSLMPCWFIARTLKTYDFPFSRSNRANLRDFTGVSVRMASQVPLPMTDCDKGEKLTLVKQLPELARGCPLPTRALINVYPGQGCP